MLYTRVQQEPPTAKFIDTHQKHKSKRKVLRFGEESMKPAGTQGYGKTTTY